jgi:hypothetical protein
MSEVEELRAEVERWKKVADIKHATTAEATARAEAAEAEVAELRQDRDEWKQATIAANRRFEAAEAEVERLHEGADETPHDPAAWMTPGQTWSHLLSLGPRQRLNRLEALITGCQEGESAQREVERIRETGFARRCVTHGGSRWPLAESRCAAGDPWDDGLVCSASPAAIDVDMTGLNGDAL